MAQTIRDCLDHFLGLTVVDITSHDPSIDPPESAHVTLMFDDGSYIRIPIGAEGLLPWGTTTDCLDHAGCIAGESAPPDPGLGHPGRAEVTSAGPVSCSSAWLPQGRPFRGSAPAHPPQSIDVRSTAIAGGRTTGTPPTRSWPSACA